MSAFAPRTIDYVENRADGGYAWDVCYDLSCVGNTVEVDLRVRLTGEDPGTYAATWQNGVDSAWNQKVFFSDGERLYEVKLDFAFVESGEHYVVNVHSGTRSFDMLNWDKTYGGGLDDEVAAHEVGHMLGNFDEYAGGATHDGYTRTGTLMSDLTVTGFQDYFGSIEHYAELYGEMSLSTVLARVGSAGSEALDGTSGMDGFYGLGGNDTIDGLAGNDYIDAGAGADVLRGGDGAYDDILLGAEGNDTLDGGAGDDLMTGGAGIDTASYQFTATGVTVNLSVTTAQNTGGHGIDTLAGIEHVTGSAYADRLTGNAANNVLKGLGRNDVLSGRGGNDVLCGDKGNDMLTGGAGLDEFIFSAALAGNVDRITDFRMADDLIRLDDDIFTALATGGLPADAFRSGAGLVSGQDPTDRVVYNTSDGSLYYDADGAGGAAARLFGILAGAPGLTAGDFVVMA